MRTFLPARAAGLLIVAASFLVGSCDQKSATAGLEPEPLGPPVMALSTSSADFSAVSHSLAPMQVIAISNAGPGVLGGLGIGSVEYFGDATAWLTASLSGTSAPTTLMLQAAAGNLAPGTYYASVHLLATGASNSPRAIDVSLRVEAAAVGPIIGLTATSASFGAVTGTSGVTQRVQILAASDAPLVGLAITDVTYDPGASGWLDASLDATTAPANLLLTPNAASLNPATYTAIVSIGAPGALNSPRTVRITLSVSSAPVPATLRLSTTAISVSGTSSAGAAPEMVSITNGGGGSLDGLIISSINYAGGPSNWLQASLSASSAPATLTLAPSLASLTPGVYTAVVSVSAANAGGPQTVTFNLTVTGGGAPGVLAVAPMSISFAGSVGGAAPALKTASLSNTGGGAMNSLAAGPISYGAGATGWLQSSLTSTSAPATLTLTPSLTGLAAGTYTATVPVSSPDASNGSQAIAVTLTVSATALPPTIGLSTASVSFSGTVGSAAPAAKTISVSNAGSGTLSSLAAGTVSYGAGATGWLSASMSGTSAPATLTLTPAITGLAAGTYTATVPVSAAGASNTPQTVSVTLVLAAAGAPPMIALTPSSLSFSATAGGAAPAAKTASVSNAGGASLSGLSVGSIGYGGGGSSWCSATLNTTTAPATLTVTPNPGALPAGTYTATIPIASASAGNTPQSISVTFTIAAAAPPAIGLSPTTLSFSATTGGASPTAKTAAVSNSGGGSLSSLAVGTITYGAGASGWAAASLSGTTAPATLTVTPTLGALAPGTYTATVPVTAAGASNSPQNVLVTLTVSSASAVSFTTDIYPTFLSGCAISGCHVPTKQKPDLSSKSAAYTNLVTATTTYVTPGNSTTGLLLGTLQGTTGPLMPPSGKLSQTFIDKVKSWIQAGAPNN